MTYNELLRNVKKKENAWKEQKIENNAEHFLQSFLTLNAAIKKEYGIELSLWRAFHDGVRICGIDGYFWLCYNNENAHHLKIMNQPKNKSFIIRNLGRVKCKNNSVEFVKEKEAAVSIAEYSKLLDSTEMIDKYYDSKIIINDPCARYLPDDSEIWIQLLNAALKYNVELFRVLQYIRACKARLILKGAHNS